MKQKSPKDPMAESIKVQFLTLLLVIVPFFVLIISIASKKILFIVLSSILFASSIIYIIFRFSFLLSKYERLEKKIKKKKNELKEKINPTGFEKLFILSCNNQGDIYVNNYLKTVQNKKIKKMRIEPIDTNSLLVSCKYDGFDIEFSLSNDKVEWMIDSPSKYDGTKENKELEKKRKHSIDSIHNTSIEVLVDFLLTIIEESSIIIDEFKKNNEVDLVINGRLVHKLEMISKYMKLEGFSCLFTTPFLIGILVFAIVMGIHDDSVKNDIPSILTLIGACFILVFCLILAFLYGLKNVLKCYHMKNDIKKKRTNTIEEKPIKVKLVRDQRTKACSFRTIRCLILYYPNHKKFVIPFMEYISFNPKKKIKEIYAECLSLSPKKLTYLEKSRIVILGGKPYIDIIMNNMN